jgi:hypothetical protein
MALSRGRVSWLRCLCVCAACFFLSQMIVMATLMTYPSLETKVSGRLPFVFDGQGIPLPLDALSQFGIHQRVEEIGRRFPSALIIAENIEKQWGTLPSLHKHSPVIFFSSIVLAFGCTGLG